MRHIAAQTTIPVPHVYHYGTAAENPTGLGPFIIMDYIEHHQNMSRALRDPDRSSEERPVLNSNISTEKLEYLYGQMAQIMLQLFSLKFPKIGSLTEKKGENDKKFFCVGGRPLIANMNEIIVHTNAPASVLPPESFSSANEWYCALGDMLMAQLVFQHNDAVEDEDDARDKYVARQLFRNLAAEGRLATGSSSENDCILFSEDFRPANVLLDEDLRIVGVIDWEFACVAPAQWTFDPPWWLLLEDPDWWPEGYREWMTAYEPRLQTFLRVLEAEEKKAADKSLAERVGDMSLTSSKKYDTTLPLSQRMRESWESQMWMLNYAARKSWAFDFIWWKFLDEKYFGPNEDQDYHVRINLLTEPQREAMDSFVKRKMEESNDPRIVTWSDQEATDCLAQVLV